MAITASIEDQQSLLELQRLDTATDRARARMTQLRQDPEQQRLADEARLAKEQAALLRAEADKAQHLVDQAEAEVGRTRTRMEQTQKRLDAGQGGAKDLQGMSHELETLRTLLAEQEEHQLEVMDPAEAAQQAAEQAESARTAADQAVSERQQALTTEAQQVAGEGKDLMQRRQELASTLPTELVEAYETARARNNGIGAARLEGSISGASGMSLSPVELNNINVLDPTEVARCPETNALLIRE